MNGAERRAEARSRAKALAKRRGAAGMNLRLLATKLNVARTTLWRWECGDTVPSLAQVQVWENEIARAEARRASKAAIERAAR